MESLLEVQRNSHEERERCVELMTKESLKEKRTHREKVNSDQRVKSYLERYHASSKKLTSLYTDATLDREKEIKAIGGPNEFAEFYSRLKVLKDYHRKNLSENARPLTVEFQEMAEQLEDPERVEKEVVSFTDEEGYGRFLDMHRLFELFLNVKLTKEKKEGKESKRIDYITYLGCFDRFSDTEFSHESKNKAAYKTYLCAVLNYLKDFLARAKPLIDVEAELATSDKDFEAKWNEGKVPGWTKHGLKGRSFTSAPMPFDLSSYNSADELEALGMDKLKVALQALNMKCGGTLQQRAERLYNAKANKQSSEDAKAKLKSEQEMKNKEDRRKFLATTECRITRLAQFLNDEREATKENVERKQARAAGEEEGEDEEGGDDYFEGEGEEGDESVPYNPKNLPLGWDGKPIPYWLYKLHGLNIGYSCEICGNQVYKGPKAFQRHFTEWRHSHGMRCLGIPNTAHFVNITKIDEAIELWKKICSTKSSSRWNPEADEEYEDSQGNVVNRRTYEDLKRQGLL